MYGLVNKAIEQLICKDFGEEKWEEVLLDSGLDLDGFVSNQGYPDEVTYRLVGAASKVLKLEPRAILEAFGEHWVLETAKKGYGAMLDAAGDNFLEFIKNLPNFHNRVALLYPDLKPPHFEVEEEAAGVIRLHYFSERPGLDPMVTGLMQGLGKHFEQEVHVEQVQTKGDDADHSEFLVHYAS